MKQLCRRSRIPHDAQLKEAINENLCNKADHCIYVQTVIALEFNTIRQEQLFYVLIFHDNELCIIFVYLSTLSN